MFARNINEIINEILIDYQNQFPTADLSQGSLLYMKAKAYGGALWAHYNYLQKASEQIFPHTADEENYLERHANTWGITRKTNESYSSLLQRILLRIDRPPAGGNKYDYQRWAESVSGVKKAYVYTPDSDIMDAPLAGTVELVIIADDGSGYTKEIPSNALLQLVKQNIDDNRPVCQYFTNVYAPKNFSGQDGLFLVNVEIKVHTGNYDQNRLESSIKSHINSLAPNETLYNDYITALCVRAGAKSVDVMFSSKVLQSQYQFTTNSNVVIASNLKSFKNIQVNDIIWPDGENGTLYGRKVVSLDENALKLYLNRPYKGIKNGQTTEIQKRFTNNVYFTITSDKTNILAYNSIELSWESGWEGAIGRKWKWVFGDGNTSEDESPVHTYTATGEYIVKCTVLFLNQESYIEAQNTINIGVFSDGTPPNVDFQVDKIAGNNPLTVTFTDLTKGDIDLWEWDFGDGNTSNLQNPSHIYTQPGQFDVTLKATSEGGTDALLKKDYITVNATGSSPVSNFTVNKKIANRGELITFTNQSTGYNLTYLWDFGDGSSSTEENPIHIYDESGKYTVKLTGTDGDSQSDIEIKQNLIKILQIENIDEIKEDVIPGNHQMIRLDRIIING